MHLGSILVLLGALWGSNGGHALARRLFGLDKIPQGQMGILEQTQENRVLLADSNSTRELPFFVRLKDFRMEYYQPGYPVHPQPTPGRIGACRRRRDKRCRWARSWAPSPFDARFENFKMDLDGGQACRLRRAGRVQSGPGGHGREAGGGSRQTVRLRASARTRQSG